MIADPQTPARLLAGEIERAQSPEASLVIFYVLPWFNVQIEQLANSIDSDLLLGGPEMAAEFQANEQKVMAALLE